VRGKRITQREVDEIWRLREKGHAYKRIAKLINIGESTAQRYITNDWHEPFDSRYMSKIERDEEGSCAWIPTPEEIEQRVKPFRRLRESGLTGHELVCASEAYILANGTDSAKRKLKRKRKTNSRKCGN